MRYTRFHAAPFAWLIISSTATEKLNLRRFHYLSLPILLNKATLFLTTPPKRILSLNEPQKMYCDFHDVDMSDPSSVERFIVFKE